MFCIVPANIVTGAPMAIPRVAGKIKKELKQSRRVLITTQLKILQTKKHEELTDIWEPPFARRDKQQLTAFLGFLTRGSTLPPAFPAMNSQRDLKKVLSRLTHLASGFSRGSFPAYSGGTVMALHHLPQNYLLVSLITSMVLVNFLWFKKSRSWKYYNEIVACKYY